MRLLVTRPDEDAAPLIAALHARGHETVAAPLLDIRFLPPPVIPSASWQAILVTSANGVRALAHHPEAARLRAFRVIAVGEASGEAVRAAGFKDVECAEGDVISLAALVLRRLAPAAGPLLHIAGSVTAGDLKGDLEARGFSVERIVLYEAVTSQTLPQSARAALEVRGVDGVLLYSPRTARTFATLVREAGLATFLSGVTGYCLSQAVADALAGLPFAELAVAAAPSQAELLKLIDA
ncbi:MAG: uroporphyrinogen-III synthase [Parvibaculum sp.]|uniref:uroporphyrinogen-III synthase n=1 Tax=Parvibaculum sp. TaxID=2024848 RepID=UPI003C788CA5